MNKAELVDKVAKTTNLTKAEVERVINATIDTIKEAVKSGDTVKLVKFGTFSKCYRNARTGRNPKTGEPIQINAAYYPKFKPGKEFKEIVN